MTIKIINIQKCLQNQAKTNQILGAISSNQGFYIKRIIKKANLKYDEIILNFNNINIITTAFLHAMLGFTDPQDLKADLTKNIKVDTTSLKSYQLTKVNNILNFNNQNKLSKQQQYNQIFDIY